MKLAVSGAHRDFFRKHHRIEFDGLLTERECELLSQKIILTLSNRYKVKTGKFSLSSEEDQFLLGRDLWRDSPALKKSIHSKVFAEVASELVEIKPIRYAYDQFFPAFYKGPGPDENIYTKYLENQKTWAEISSIQGLLCGLMLCIKSPAIGSQHAIEQKNSEGQGNEQKEGENSVFSHTAGNGVFFSPKMVLNFHPLPSLKGGQYLLIAYSQHSSVYTYQENDPLTHVLMHLGYAYGDRLSDKFHPLLIT